jgi:2',3'-cyclic-nucleotide 2'-phosphodiesterase (5'-nucleotidase family)
MTDRRKFIAQVTMAASAATFLRPLNIFAGSSRQNPFLVEQLTILHTSNLQGQWEMLPENDKLHGLGGLRQLSRQIKEIRSKTAATLVIHT